MEDTKRIVELNPEFNSAINISSLLLTLTPNDWKILWDEEDKIIIWTLTGKDREIIIWRTETKTVVFRLDCRCHPTGCKSLFTEEQQYLIDSVEWIK